MNFVGRIIKDAVVSQLKDERKVVNFSVAVNDYYKPKGKEQGVKMVLYINCSYWISTTIAGKLSKGSLVEISGRMYLNTYTGADNEARTSLNCHVNNIKIHSGKAANSETGSKKIQEQVEDLPF